MVRLRNAAGAVLLLAVLAHGQSAEPKKPRTGQQIAAQEVVISGTTALDSAQLHDIADSLISVTMGDDEEEVRDRIRDKFQQRGYFDAQVTSLEIVVLDPLAKKKPVRIQAEVEEGPLFHFAAIEFTGNKAFSSEELRKLVVLKVGDIFSTGKGRSALDSLRARYVKAGYLEFVPIPNTEKSGSAQIMLSIDIDEGTQYRMGELKIGGKSDSASKLQAEWELKTGEPYDPGYLGKYLTEHRDLLPDDFSSDRDVLWLRDCSDDTVNVTIELDPKRPWTPMPQDKPCEPKKDPHAVRE